MLSWTLGPFTLAADHIILLAALLLACWAGGRSARARGARNPESTVFALLALAMVAARLGFILRYHQQYLAHPWQMLDIRDGGLLLWPGLLALLLGAAWLAWCRPAQRRPLAVALGTGLLFWAAANAATSVYDSRQTVGSVAVSDAVGRPVDLRDYRGRPMVVNLWATWCPPCRREMPALLEAAQAHPDVRFVLLNQGETQRVVADFMSAGGLDSGFVLFDPDSAMGRAVGSAVLPTTLFYDAHGRLQRSHVGELSRASLEHALETLQAR